MQLNGIVENEFYNHDVYGDIRFNPNDTCGGPAILYRSHNTYNRTYHKTSLQRVINNPEKNALDFSANPFGLFQPSGQDQNNVTQSS